MDKIGLQNNLYTPSKNSLTDDDELLRTEDRNRTHETPVQPKNIGQILQIED